MSNRGAVPVDITTDVGRLRANVGDTQYVALDPAEAGFGDFTYFSDDELESLLETADESLTRATGYAYRSLAGILAMTASSITTDDLRIDTLGRAKLMRELSAEWLRDADAEDTRMADDIFDIVPFGGMDNGITTWPELEARSYPI